MENPSMKNLSLRKNTMISRVRLIAHVHLLACVPARARAIARVSGNSIPTSEYEIQNIISSLNSKKSVGSNSIPTRTLKLLKNDISTQLADIFNNSFSTGIFPT